MQNRQKDLLAKNWDWSFIEYYQKSFALETDPEQKLETLHCLRHYEATRDLHCKSIKEIHPLIQFDPEPNRDLTEAKVELYKISVSFGDIRKGKFNIVFT